MGIVPTRSLVLFIRVWMGSMAGQIAARMGIRVKGIPMASSRTVDMTMPATLMEMGRVAAEEVVVTATIIYPSKQQELVSRLEELADVQVGNDCSNLMSLGQLEIG